MASYSSKLAHLNTWRETAADVRFGSKADMCSAQADVRFVPIADIQALHRLSRVAHSFEPLRREQEVVEGLCSRCHTLGLRAKNLSVGGQHFDIVSFVDALGDSRRHQ